MEKRTKGWLALKGLWGKRSSLPPKKATPAAADDDEIYVHARSIPKVSEEDLWSMVTA